jgi:hypothetical protein
MSTKFKVGELVQLVGLVSSKLLNGTVGTVVNDTNYEVEGRFYVSLKTPATAVAKHPSGISLKPKNLIKMVCGQPGCDQLGRLPCTGCLKDFTVGQLVRGLTGRSIRYCALV